MCVIIDSQNVIVVPNSNSVCVSLHSLSHRERLWIQLFSHLSYGLNSIADWTLRSWLEVSLRKRILWTQNQLSVNQTKKILATETTNLVKLWPIYLHESLMALTSIFQRKKNAKYLSRESGRNIHMCEFWKTIGLFLQNLSKYLNFGVWRESPFLVWTRTFQHCLVCVMYIYTHLQHTGECYLSAFLFQSEFQTSQLLPVALRSNTLFRQLAIRNSFFNSDKHRT